MRTIVTVGLALVVAGCASAEPEVVSGTAHEVVIKAGTDRNPGLLAAEHCARHGKDAALRGSEVIGRRTGTWLDPVHVHLFHFDCV